MMFTTLRRTRARERSHANESHRGRSRRETSRRTLIDENTHQNLHRLVTVTDGDVRGNLFVTADTERTDGVSRLGEDRLLTGELLQNLGRLREAIPAFPNANVKDELVDANSPHRVLSLFFSLRARSIDRHRHRLVSHRAVTPCASRCDHASATPTHRRRDAIQPPSHHHTRAHAPPSQRAASPHPSRSRHGKTPKPPSSSSRARAMDDAPSSSSPGPTRRRDAARRPSNPRVASRHVTSRHAP